MPYSDYLKQRALYFYQKGMLPRAIVDALADEGMTATRQGLAKMINRYEATGTLQRRPGSGRPSVITPQIKSLVEEQMRNDDETTAIQLEILLRRKGYTLSRSTILRSRLSLGWTFRGSAYCQLIRDANKANRLEWARQHLHEAADGFMNVVFTDETSIQLEAHRRFCFRKREQPRPKPRFVYYTNVMSCHVYTRAYCTYNYTRSMYIH